MQPKIRSFASVLRSHVTQWRLFIFISRESKWGTLQSAGNPRCAVPAEIHSICTDRPRPGPAAGLQVSPTSDKSAQSVGILMNTSRSHLTEVKRSRRVRILRRMRTVSKKKVFGNGKCELSAIS